MRLIDSKLELPQGVDPAIDWLPAGAGFIRPARLKRRTVAARLRSDGYEVGPPLLQVDGAAGSRYLVPLQAGPLRLLGRLLTQDAATAHVVGGVLSLLARSRAAAEVLDVGFFAWRSGAAHPLEWLARAGVADAEPSRVLVARGWRGAGDTVLLYLLDGAGAVTAVAKVCRADALTAEDELLASVGATGAIAGVAVPSRLGTVWLGGRRAFGMSAVPGESAVGRLRRRPAEAADLLGRLARWLESWNAATVQRLPLAQLLPDLLEPLDVVAPRVPDSAPYAQAVRALAHSLADARLPLVATHNDLTLYNVRLDGARAGIVDWEAARARDLPLGDLEYLAVDLAATMLRDRPAAWRLCVDADDASAARSGAGAVATRFRALRARSAALLQLPPAYIELCHHLVWLRHAANEQRAGAAADAPFLQIVRELVRRGVAPHG